LTLNAHGSAGARSRNELAFLSMLTSAHLPDPILNTRIDREEVDFHWPEHKLAVEIDGPGHKRPRTRKEDALKEAAITRAGYQLLRFTDEDLEQRPTQVIQTVTNALG
jgi:very-short-patch-repair endonuclease